MMVMKMRKIAWNDGCLTARIARSEGGYRSLELVAAARASGSSRTFPIYITLHLIVACLHPRSIAVFHPPSTW